MGGGKREGVLWRRLWWKKGGDQLRDEHVRTGVDDRVGKDI